MKIVIGTMVKRCCLWFPLLMALVQCLPSTSSVLQPSYQLLPVNDTYTPDSLTEVTIGPYREQLAEQMDVVIGHSKKWLVEGEVESLLGNFVADAILLQSSRHYPDKIHMSVINNSGLRAPIPEGPIKISNIYELMPFENLLYILELDGSQTQSLFNLLARDKRASVANSVVIIENNKPTKVFIDGAPFREEERYVLAVSDYLAQGGSGMEFLKQAKVLATFEVKIRDLIIEYIKQLAADGVAIDAEIEGRVQLMP